MRRKQTFTDKIIKVETINQLHSFAGIGEPRHPLVSIIDYSKVDTTGGPASGRFMLGFYSIAYKYNCSFQYGKELFDHKEGTLHCTAPGQIISYNKEKDENISEGWGLYFHPELIRKTSLKDKIHHYSFFLYNENEALHLIDEEKETITTLLKQIEKEYYINIDNYSEELIVSNIELLLNYCKRFYGRQFHSRLIQNKAVISKFEKFILEYIHSGKLKESGLPSVKYCAAHMNLTPNYFSDLLKSETGMNTQEHIHYYIIEKAKALLANTDCTVNEVADELGFEYPQYFRKLFKKKVGLTPLEFRTH